MDDRLSAAVPSRDGVRLRGPVQPMGPTRPGRGDPAGSPLRGARVALWAGADVSPVVRRAALALQSHDQAAGARARHDAGAGDELEPQLLDRETEGPGLLGEPQEI